ncbi:Double Clp-N motif-containing protein [Cynara cardunculus var. scolymus]|uniref:Double Clp-N motif-containing protein n=1 Tax=Cynara cardunculus var. scolymus TaxID=59895 RepID=A0A103Y2K5_CYNCS|nr:Double Clp-N motif-containing protein [Cynara cardunculus var. scolymus]
MRAGLSTILQTLTPDAASVLNHSIAEAGRRNHNQTTPLHVAATLLAAPTGFLRQACIRSHPNSSHPLQCRALELCFSVALERLPLQGGNHQRNDETAVSSSSPMNLYLNPRLQQGNLSLNQSDDAKRVIEIMTKSRKRNPILVGEFEPESIKKDILRRIQTGDLEFKNAEVISIEKEFESLPDKSQIPAKIKELLESRIGGSDDDRRSIIIDLADLKWLIEQPPTAAVSDIGRESVAEMSKLLAKFTAENSKVWLIGTATCETYLRCQVYHPSMENDWDLQAVPISSRSPLSGSHQIMNLYVEIGVCRFGTNGILGSSVDSLNSFKNFQTTIYQRHPTCCPKCYHDYEQELAKLDESKSSLPQWLQNAKAQNGESETKMNRRSSVLNSVSYHLVNDQELQKKWSDICTRIHPNHNQSLSLARMTTGFVPVVPTYKPANRRVLEAPRSPVRTELVLGPKEVVEDSPVKDLLGCISSEPRSKIEEFQKGKFVNSADADSFKKLVKGLMKAAWWQPEAASAIATTVTQFCSRGSVWLLFAGPDRVGKKKMASVLAEHVCAANPITVCLGSRRDEDETDLGFRGKMVLDRIVEAVRRNPFSVIVLSDIDEADMLVRASIKQAMERGRFTDSYGREISLGSSIFVLTGNWSTNNVDEHLIDEKRLHSAATGEWRLKLTICEKRSKRRADWLPEEKISTKQQKKAGCGLSLDLNLAVDSEEDRTDASDLTTEQGDENPHFVVKTSVPHELVGPSDAAVVFKPVQFGLIRREIEKTIKNTFLTVVEETVSIEVDEGTLDNILSGIWFGRTCLEDWAETVLVPSFHKLTEHLSSTRGNLVVRLESVRDPDQAGHGGDRLPSQINVIVDTV